MAAGRWAWLGGWGWVVLGVPLAAGLGGGCASPAGVLPDGTPRPRLVAPHREGIVLDGDLSDWAAVPFVEVAPSSGRFDPNASKDPVARSPADLSFRFAVCHDDEALYVAVEVTDDAVRADSCRAEQIDAPAWDDDAVEVFVDGNHNRAPDSRVAGGAELAWGGEFSLVVNGAAMSDYSGFPKTFGRAGCWSGATNWPAPRDGAAPARYEFRLCWKMMGGKVRPGATIGFNLSVQDDDNGGRRDHALYWTGNPPRLFSDERGFGDLYLQPR